jgi:TPP-dependent pyruvate/acetoin dehydrogenase alpha subunit
MNRKELIAFESRLADRFTAGELPCLVHFSGGNETELLRIFKRIGREDWIFSTHRSHYHYLLAGGDAAELERMVRNGQSMFVFDARLRFYTSSIVAGTVCIAAGTALAIKRRGGSNRVWCFVGDGAEDEGHFYEAVRYVDGWDLPCTFVIEDNDRSVTTPKAQRYGRSSIAWPACVERYQYTATRPHAGSGKWKQR